jgi:WhiB family redox-sensing transcriptional regulator
MDAGRLKPVSRSKKTPKPADVEAARHDPRLRQALDVRRTNPEWRLRGRCLSVDPETFFPEPQARESPNAALALCSGCGVRSSCLAWALDAGDRNGVWGGTTPRERQAMLIAWHDAIPAA